MLKVNKTITLEKTKIKKEGRKVYLVNLTLNISLVEGANKKTVDLEKITNYYRLSIMGEIIHERAKEAKCCGQIIEEVKEYCFSPKAKEIAAIWKEWHLNDMQAGTSLQEEAIELWKKIGNKYDYKEVCNYLSSIGLYEDRGYKYGTSWLVKPLPMEVIERICSLFGVEIEVVV